MKPLYTKLQFKIAKSNEKLPLKCYACNNTFFVLKRVINDSLKKRKGTSQFCSQKCVATTKKTSLSVSCKNCNKIFNKRISQIKKCSNNFCSLSCAGFYNNTHKTHGTRRSKLETYIEEQLTILYPDLHIDYNKKEAINSELDIYIPSMKLAFELNGIFHYESIYGEEKLNSIQNNDQRKFQACAEKNISLCIIDTSRQKYFKKNTSQEYINIIINIINNKSKNIF